MNSPPNACRTKDVDELTTAVGQLAKNGQLSEALEKTAALEKKSRNAADMVSTTRCILTALSLIRSTPSTSQTNWTLLSETIISYSKKHGQLKQAITKMVQMSMCYLHPPNSQQPASVIAPPKEEDTKMEEAAKTVEANAETTKEEKKKTEREKDRERRQAEKEKEGQEAVEVTKLIDEARKIGDAGLDQPAKKKLVETLRQVTEGKVSERAGERKKGGNVRQSSGSAHSLAVLILADLRRGGESKSDANAVRNASIRRRP